MSLTTYDLITSSFPQSGGEHLIQYDPATYTVDYPNSNFVNISGPLWLPKVYGKDLTAFEIASSGKIAITINDIHSIDIKNSNGFDGTNNHVKTSLNTRSNYAFEMKTYSGEVALTMNAYSNDMNLHAHSNVFINTTADNVDIQGARHVLVNAGSNLRLHANASNMYIDMLKDSSNVGVFSSCNVSVEAGKTLGLYANASNLFVKMDHVDSNLTVFSSCNITTAASNVFRLETKNDVFMNARDGSLKMYANASNMSLLMEQPNNTVTLYSSNDTNITTTNELTITACNVIGQIGKDYRITACNDYYVSACNTATLSCKEALTLSAKTLNFSALSDVSFTAQSNLNFNILASSGGANSPVFIISSNAVKVNGDLIIEGQLNTSNVVNTVITQESLKINDKTIRLANRGSNYGVEDDGLPLDGLVTNDKSGVVIDGYPTATNSNNYWAGHGKSLLWNYGSAGTTSLGTNAGIETESFWEMTGGSMRLTHKKDMRGSGLGWKDVTFGFRINEYEELEIIKKYWNLSGSNYVFRRVAKFGRLLA